MKENVTRRPPDWTLNRLVPRLSGPFNHFQYWYPNIRHSRTLEIKCFLWKMYEVYRGSKVEQVDRDGLSGLRRYRGRACRWIPCCAMALRLTLPYMQAETNGNLGTSRVVWGLFSPGHGLELCAERWQRRNLVSAVIG